METKVSLALVGAFVLALSAALVAGVLWIASGRTARKDYEPYLAYFTESISGLNLRAPVKYKGVEVGYVRQIGLDPADPERVRLELAIERGVPIKTDTVAVLSVQGLTGIAFLDLAGGSRDAPLLVPPETGEPPVIATRPSLFRRLDVGTTALLSELSETAHAVNELLDPETRSALRQTLRDLQEVAHVLATRSGEIDASLADAARTLGNTARASAELDALVAQVAKSAAAVEQAAAEVSRAGVATAEAADGAGRLERDLRPELERLLADARVLTASLARVARELERNPNALVLGRGAQRPGPGE